MKHSQKIADVNQPEEISKKTYQHPVLIDYGTIQSKTLGTDVKGSNYDAEWPCDETGDLCTSFSV